MKITDIHDQTREIQDAEQLCQLLTRPGERAFVIHSEGQGAELWLHLSGEVAYLHYFPSSDGAHPGFQPSSVARPEHHSLPDTVTFPQIGGSQADRIEVPKEVTISVSQAIAAATQFLDRQELPTELQWSEL